VRDAAIIPAMTGSVRSTLRRLRAAYHRLVPRQRPNGVLPWRTPILTLAVWTPVAALVPLLSGAPPDDVTKTPTSVLFVATLMWLGRIRHAVLAWFACYLVAVLSGMPFDWPGFDWPGFDWPGNAATEFVRRLGESVAGAYVFAAMSRWDAPRLVGPVRPFPEAWVGRGVESVRRDLP
jgi:hypothetical protein